MAILLFLHLLTPSPDSTANSDWPINRLIGILLLSFLTLDNTNHQIQQQIQISLYTVLLAIVRLGFYYYFFTLFNIHHQYQQQIQIGLNILVAIVRWPYYYFYTC